MDSDSGTAFKPDRHYRGWLIGRRLVHSGTRIEVQIRSVTVQLLCSRVLAPSDCCLPHRPRPRPSRGQRPLKIRMAPSRRPSAQSHCTFDQFPHERVPVDTDLPTGRIELASKVLLIPVKVHIFDFLVPNSGSAGSSSDGKARSPVCRPGDPPGIGHALVCYPPGDSPEYLVVDRQS